MKKITLLIFMMFSVVLTFGQVGISENFDSGTPAGWTDSYGNSATASCAGNSERDNLYSFSTTGNLTSPNQVALSNGTDLTVSFDYKVVDWSDTNNPTAAGWGSAELQYSTDDGTTWNSVFTIDDSNHTASTTCATVTNVIPAASLPTGSDVKLRVFNTWLAGDYYFYIDNFSATQVVATPPSCDATLTQTTDVPLNGDISWSAATGIPTGYVITAGTTSGGNDLADNVDVGNTTSYNLGTLTSGATYYVTIVPYNANGSATGCVEQSFTAFVPLPGDTITDPVAIVPSEEGTVCNTTEYPFSFDFQSGYTDSGLDGTCNGTSTGLDIFFSWTATSDALIWNDGGGNPGIVIREAATGNEITCVGTFAAADYVLSGWNIGDDLILQVYDFGTASVNPLSFCLAEYNLPSVPECTSNYVSTPDATCGSLDTTLSWDAGVDADGYFLTVGTTSGGNDILDNVDIGNVTTYDVGSQTESTTYFWTLTPYNITGSAEGCTENTYTTIAAQCYCTSTTTSIDGSGISNLQVATTDFTSGGTLSYEDFTGAPVDVAAGINTNIQITFATGFSYGVNIWIDFNDDFVFDSSELLFTGEETTGVNPTTYDASFLMPAAAALGTHRMRIVTDDTNADAADPCNSTSWHVTMDVDVNIIEATCSPAVATTSVVPDCGNDQFFIDVDVTDLGDGTPVIDDGTNTYPVSAIGVVQVGPYASGSSVTLVITHGTDSSCDTSLGTVSYTCPPVNDDICNAIALTVDATSTGDAFTNVAATEEVGEVVGSCFNSGINGSVWFSFVAPITGNVRVTTDIAGATLTDTEVAVYVSSDGTCVGTLTELACDQDGGTVVNFNSIADVFGLQPGDTYFVQVDRWGSASDGDFGIEVITLPPDNDECTGAYPLTLGVEMVGDNSFATDSGVASACGTGIVSDVWYSFVAPASTEVNITCSAANYSILSDCTTEIACNVQTVTGLTAGQTYYVKVTDDGTAKMQAPGAFTLTVSEVSLSIDGFDNEAAFTYYPNPVNNNLTLSAQKEINNVSVYNMIGQEVYRNVPNAMTEVVDMSNLQAGAYFVKVTVGTATKTVKVIKK